MTEPHMQHTQPSISAAACCSDQTTFLLMSKHTALQRSLLFTGRREVASARGRVIEVEDNPEQGQAHGVHGVLVIR